MFQKLICVARIGTCVQVCLENSFSEVVFIMFVSFIVTELFSEVLEEGYLSWITYFEISAA